MPLRETLTPDPYRQRTVADTLAAWAQDGQGNHRRRDAVWPQLVGLVEAVAPWRGMVNPTVDEALDQLRDVVEAQSCHR